jgi:hypothetical protein
MTRTLAASLFALGIATSASAQSEERQAFIGINIGPAIPFGTFADKSTTNARAGRAKLGYNDSFLNFGKRLGTHWGVSATVFYNEHDIEDPAKDDWWQVAGLTVGPMYTRSIAPRTLLDLKMKLGFITTTQVIDEFENARGDGLATDMRLGLRYNVHRRWALVAETGVLYSDQKIRSGGTMGFRALITGLGFAYRPGW